MTDRESTRRWYHLTPDRLIVGLLAVQVFLLLSEQSQWFGFNEKKGWTVLIAFGVACSAVVIMFLWGAVSLLFRWRFQFSVRSLVVLVVAIAIPCCWLAVKRQQALEQREAFKAFREFPGIIRYDFQLFSPAAEPPAPSYLRNMLGDDFFADLEHVCLGRGHDFTDAQLAHARELPGLKSLRLNGAAITDNGLKHLQNLKSVEQLSFCRTRITDAGLEHLSGLASLQHLHLADTAVTNAGLAQLRSLTNLEVLNLASTEVTDEGLERLTRLTKLRSLNLRDTRVTDAGLPHLQGLTKLEKLHLSGDSVTDRGIQKLQEALPNCKIER